ncbi:MAG: molybdopterin-dependent oxidoreductase [Betaproteobacteria bacterium]|nr:MAG: molybdopterin-dependent oxidoreductase [Betaproteobacteria bacterium]
MAMDKDWVISRRTFLAAAGGTLVSIGLPGTFVKLADAEQYALAASTRPDGRPRLPPGQTAVEKIRNMGGTPGTADVTNWKLRVYGQVKRPIVLSYQDLLDLEQVDIVCDIHCVTGWSLLDSRWSGVRLKTIIDEARPRADGRFVIFEAAAGFTSNIPISDIHEEDVILAHSLFGEKLPRANGAPVRAIVPDRYFYKSAKWLEAVKVSARDEPGSWESLGYSNSADPWTGQRFDEKR